MLVGMFIATYYEDVPGPEFGYMLGVYNEDNHGGPSYWRVGPEPTAAGYLWRAPYAGERYIYEITTHDLDDNLVKQPGYAALRHALGEVRIVLAETHDERYNVYVHKSDTPLPGFEGGLFNGLVADDLGFSIVEIDTTKPLPVEELQVMTDDIEALLHGDY